MFKLSWWMCRVNKEKKIGDIRDRVNVWITVLTSIMQLSWIICSTSNFLSLTSTLAPDLLISFQVTEKLHSSNTTALWPLPSYCMLCANAVSVSWCVHLTLLIASPIIALTRSLLQYSYSEVCRCHWRWFDFWSKAILATEISICFASLMHRPWCRVV